MTDFPRMLYRKGSEANLCGFDCDTRIVGDEAEHDEAQGEGWFDTPGEAHGEQAKRARKAPADTGAIDALTKQLTEAEQLLATAIQESDAHKARADAAEAENAELKARIAKFDGDRDGKPGGSKPKEG